MGDQINIWIKKGVKLVEEKEGDGPIVLRQHNYVLEMRVALSKGEIVSSPSKCLSHSIDEDMKVSEDGYFKHRTRIDRENLIAGIFYAVQDMKVDGYRKVTISSHLAYGENGIPGVIPPNAKITVEIRVIRELAE
jgi:flagellar basal body rod protein FlgF